MPSFLFRFVICKKFWLIQTYHNDSFYCIYIYLKIGLKAPCSNFLRRIRAIFGPTWPPLPYGKKSFIGVYFRYFAYYYIFRNTSIIADKLKFKNQNLRNIFNSFNWTNLSHKIKFLEYFQPARYVSLIICMSPWWIITLTPLIWPASTFCPVITGGDIMCKPIGY